MNPLRSAQSAYVRYFGYHAVLITIGAVLLDRAVTLLYWQHEANYVVETMGAYWWSVATVMILATLFGVWYFGGMYRSKIGHGIAWIGAGMHLLAVVTNLLWVHGYY